MQRSGGKQSTVQMQTPNVKRERNCVHPRACVVKGAMQGKKSEGQDSANVKPFPVQVLPVIVAVQFFIAIVAMLLLDHIIATRDISNANKDSQSQKTTDKFCICKKHL